MKKKLLLSLLLVAIMACLLVVTASAVEFNGVHYTLDEANGTATVNTENQAAQQTVFEIPSEITVGEKSYKVTKIENRAFANNTTVVEIRILSEYITEIPEAMFTNTAATLNKVFIDFSKITKIPGYGLNVSQERNDRTPTPCLDTFRFYDAKAYIADKSEVVITNPDFSNLTFLGDAAFQNCAKFDTIILPPAANIQQQALRNTTAQHVKVMGEIESIPTHFLAGAKNLLTVEFSSRSIKTVASSAVTTGSKNLEWIKIDLSKCTFFDGSAFTFSTGYDQGNTTTIWYDLDGNRRVDLSSAKTIKGQSFASTNIGGFGATEIIWPQALTSLTNQAFRRCNIGGTMYINFEEGVTATLEGYNLHENRPTLVILGPGVTKIDGQLEAACTVVALADTIELARSAGVFKYPSESTLYCKNATFVHESRPNIVYFTSGTINYTKLCGITADLIVEGQAVRVGTENHSYVEGEYDNTMCPINNFKTHTCSKCEGTKLVSDIDGLTPKKHEHTAIFKIAYEDYTEYGLITYKCVSCDSTEVEDSASASPIFTYLGFSTDNKTSSYICVGYAINQKALSEYKAVTQELELGYGMVATSTAISTRPIANDGNKVDDRIMQANVSSMQDSNVITCIDLLIMGDFKNEANANASLGMAMYVTRTNGEGTAVSYICSAGEVTDIEAVTYAQKFPAQIPEN